jgi:HAD superfamily hydrolase (TIGR01509 family)
MKSCGLIIFDCDGVLIDSEIFANRAWLEVFAELGHDLDLDDFMQRYVGISSKDVRADLDQRHGPLPPDLEARITTRRRALFERHLKPMPGIEHLLAALDVPVCVASGSAPERLEHSLGLTGLLPFFPDRVFSATMVAHGKPAPDLFLFAAEQCGVAAGRCLVVEDSVPGVQAAVAAGMTVIGFVGGAHCQEGHEERLLTHGASRVIENWDLFPAIVNEVTAVSVGHAST